MPISRACRKCQQCHERGRQVSAPQLPHVPQTGGRAHRSRRRACTRTSRTTASRATSSTRVSMPSCGRSIRPASNTTPRRRSASTGSTRRLRASARRATRAGRFWRRRRPARRATRTSTRATSARAAPRCHKTNVSFKAASESFNHRLAKFALTGAHQTTACASCHKPHDLQSRIVRILYELPYESPCAAVGGWHMHELPHDGDLGDKAVRSFDNEIPAPRQARHGRVRVVSQGGRHEGQAGLIDVRGLPRRSSQGRIQTGLQVVSRREGIPWREVRPRDHASTLGRRPCQSRLPELSQGRDACGAHGARLGGLPRSTDRVRELPHRPASGRVCRHLRVLPFGQDVSRGDVHASGPAGLLSGRARAARVRDLSQASRDDGQHAALGHGRGPIHGDTNRVRLLPSRRTSRPGRHRLRTLPYGEGGQVRAGRFQPRLRHVPADGCPRAAHVREVPHGRNRDVCGRPRDGGAAGRCVERVRELPQGRAPRTGGPRLRGPATTRRRSTWASTPTRIHRAGSLSARTSRPSASRVTRRRPARSRPGWERQSHSR